MGKIHMLLRLTKSLDSDRVCVAPRKQGMRLLALMAAIAMVSAQATAAVNIADAGTAQCVIVLAPSASVSQQYAASELAVFLERMTGATFQTVSTADPAKSNIFVGPTAALQADPSFSVAGLGEESLVIRTVGSDLILAGGEPRGTLYAVYSFLEDQLGCHWWTPTVMTIPDSPTLSVDALDTTYVPTLEYREHNYYHAMVGEWAARNRFNASFHRLSETQGGKRSYTALSGWYVHTFWSLLPPDTYYAAHPDWYVLHNGEPASLDLTNEAMRVELVNQLRIHLQAHPDAQLVSVSQIDDDGFNGQLNGGTTPDGRNDSDLLIEFINQVAADIEAEFPDILVSTLAYHYTQAPPNQAVPRSNVLIRLANIGCSFSVPVTDERNATFRDDLLAWSAIAGRLYVWSYAANFTYQKLPHPNLRVWGPNMQFYIANSVKGLFQESPGYGDPDTELGELRSWVLAKLMWKPTSDVDDLIAEFCHGYYGAAAPHILAYLDLMHDRIEATGDYLNLSSPPTAAFLDFDTLDAALAHMLAAEAAVAHKPIFTPRVKKVKDSVMYARQQRGEYGHLLATASSQNSGRFPIETINGSGLTEDGLRHISLGYGSEYGMNGWVSGPLGDSQANPRGGTVPGSHWIEYRFDQIYTVDKMRIWNYHEYIPTQGLDWRSMGCKEVTIQYSLTGSSDPADWTTIYDGAILISPAVEEAPVSLVVDFGGVDAKCVVITADAGSEKNWTGGSVDGVGLSEVVFCTVPPFDGPTVVPIGSPTVANAWDTTGAVSVTASHPGYSDREWINTINGSGLDSTTGTLHNGGSPYGFMGIAAGTPNPRGGTINDGVYGNRWIEYSFDQIYALDSMDVWAYNENNNYYWASLTAKDVFIQVSTTGGADLAEWSDVATLSLAHSTFDAGGLPVTNSINLGDIAAQHVVITLKNGSEGTYAKGNLGSNSLDFGLSEVRFHGAPLPPPPEPIGNPTAANGWDTTSAVSVRASHSHSSSPQQRAWINTINGSGLDAATGTLHGTTVTGTMGASGSATVPNPRGGTINDWTYGDRWIEFSFDKVYDVDRLDVWAYNENGGWAWGALSTKDVYIQASTTGRTDPADWTTVAETSLRCTPGNPIAVSSTIDFGGMHARYVVITLKNGPEGTYIRNMGLDLPDFGLSEIRFYGLPNPDRIICGEEGTVYLAGDVNRDCYVDFNDLLSVAGQWLDCTDPANAMCESY